MSGLLKNFVTLTVVSGVLLVNQAAHLSLPGLPGLPDSSDLDSMLGIHPDKNAPKWCLGGVPPRQPGVPGDELAAYGQNAGLGGLMPDLPDVPSALGQFQGRLLHNLTVKPPSDAEIAQTVLGAYDGGSRYLRSLRAAAQGQAKPADVSAFEESAYRAKEADKAAFRARQVAACNPCRLREGARRSSLAAFTTVTAADAGAGVARRAAAAAGFTGPDLDVAVAVAGAESGYRAEARNENRNGSTDFGLWQINSVHSDVLAAGDWSNPADNARMAYSVWAAAGRSWSPWAAYNSGAYREHLHLTNTGPVVQNVADGPSMTCASYPVAPAAGVSGGAGAWGGYSNGRIPVKAMCRPGLDSRALLRCDAAAALDRLNLAYRARFGRSITITDSYRDFASQVRVKASKGDLAARPGKSNHGWGLALDLGGGVQSFTTSQHAWMAAHAPAAGWVNPSWARPGGSKPEPWHFEYTGTQVQA